MKFNKIVIVGGGTAGWMTASLFAKHWKNSGVEITLIESANIPTVGVGEGSTPYLQRLLKTLDINELEWMSACNATYKNNIEFVNWTSQSVHKSYSHPFPSTIDTKHVEALEQQNILRRQGYNCHVRPDDYLFMSMLAKQHKSPISNNNVGVKNSYGYHFDSALLGTFLSQYSQKIGVKRVVANVTKVTQGKDGEISTVYTECGNHFDGDFFVDCTGFSALLIEKTLNVPFVNYADNLFNDSAVAIPSKVANKLKPQTTSTALSAGWAWHIPLQNRVGNGYVYSSQYQSKESAEKELRNFIGEENIVGSVKHLKMRVGRTEKHWHKNCLAIGLSQGFIEPLEATALHITQTSIEDFIELIEKGNGSTQAQDYFNEKVNFHFERIRDFIVLHYFVNTRNDTQYWHDVRTKIQLSDYLYYIMEEWNAGKNLTAFLDRLQISQYFSSTSWHCILAGSGKFPAISKQDLPQHSKKWPSLNSIQKVMTEQLKNYPDL